MKFEFWSHFDHSYGLRQSNYITNNWITNWIPTNYQLVGWWHNNCEDHKFRTTALHHIYIYVAIFGFHVSWTVACATSIFVEEDTSPRAGKALYTNQITNNSIIVKQCDHIFLMTSDCCQPIHQRTYILLTL